MSGRSTVAHRNRVTYPILVVSAVVVVILALQPTSTPNWLAGSDLVAVVCTAVLGVAAMTADRRSRSVWLLLLAAQAVSVAADMVYDYSTVNGVELGFAGEVPYLVSGAIRLVALVVLVKARSAHLNVLVWIDAALVGVTAFAVLGLSLLVPLSEMAPDAMLTASATYLYLMLDLLTFAVLVRLMLAASWSWPLFLVLGGQILFFASDIVYNLSVVWDAGHLAALGAVQAGWLASYLVTAYAASRPDAAALTDPGVARDHRFQPGEFLAVAAVTMLVPTLIALLFQDVRPQEMTFLVYTNVALMGLILSRAWVLLRTGQRQADNLQTLARTDPLTGLLNRRSWEHLLARAVQQTSERGITFVVGMGDLDRFKEYNDEYGHPAGDDLLVDCARRWTGVLPANATIARLGGDEFAFLIPNVTPMTALPTLERVLQATPPAVTLSLGVTETYPDATPDDLASFADVALYAAKRTGRNKVEIFSKGWDVPVDAGADRFARPVGR